MKTRHSLNVEYPRKRRILQRPEQALQNAVRDLLDLVLPQNAVWWHTPNGGYRTPAEAAIFKRMGVKAGVPDIVIFWDGRAFGLELKTGDETLNPDQRAMHARLRDARIRVEVVRSLDDVVLRLSEYGIPLAKHAVIAQVFRDPDHRGARHAERAA